MDDCPCSPALQGTGPGHLEREPRELAGRVSVVAVPRLSRPVGFSACRVRASHRGDFSCCRAPGIEPVSPALAGGFFTTEPPGKPQRITFFSSKVRVACSHTNGEREDPCRATGDWGLDMGRGPKGQRNISPSFRVKTNPKGLPWWSRG